MGANVAVCFETGISVFGQAAFYACKESVPRNASEWFRECQQLISGEGASSPLSPRRLRVKYTLRTNLRFMLRGFRPAGGKFAPAQIYTVRKSRTVFIHAAGRTGAWTALTLMATFQGKCAASQRELHRTKPPAAVRKRQP